MKNVACCSPLDASSSRIYLLQLGDTEIAVVHLAADQGLIQSFGNAAGGRVTHGTLNHSHGYDAVHLTPP